MHSEEFQLRRRILQGENLHLDFKHAISDSRKIARSMVAFANADGGSLLIGVKDNGSIAGICSEEEFYMAEKAANIYCRPAIIFDSVLWQLDGRDVLEMIIPPRPEMLNTANVEDNSWQVFVRSADQDHLANSVWVDVWTRRQSHHDLTVDFNDKYKKALILFRANDEMETSDLMIHLRSSKGETERIIADLILLNYVTFVFNAAGIAYRCR